MIETRPVLRYGIAFICGVAVTILVTTLAAGGARSDAGVKEPGTVKEEIAAVKRVESETSTLVDHFLARLKAHAGDGPDAVFDRTRTIGIMKKLRSERMIPFCLDHLMDGVRVDAPIRGGLFSSQEALESLGWMSVPSLLKYAASKPMDAEQARAVAEILTEICGKEFAGALLEAELVMEHSGSLQGVIDAWRRGPTVPRLPK